jgi:hypothetical protein
VWGWKNTRGVKEWLEGRKRRKGKCVLQRERERGCKQASKQGTTHKQRTSRERVTQHNKQNMKIATVPNK